LASLFATATSIGRSADGVAQAQEFTIAALTQAQDGVAAVQSVRQSIDVAAQSVQLATETMRELERRSLEIENVVSLIKDVADQTKLIALNAAIEAARAGSHGRGFSVVADAVRRLAEQTGQATAQVAQLIGGIQRDTAQAVQHLARAQVEVAGGVAKTGQAGAELQRIADTADQMVQTIDTIAEATHAALTSHAEATGLLDQVAADPPPTAKG
jgi:methyl-accepting chemotaxis protein